MPPDKCQIPTFGLPAPFGPGNPVTLPGSTVKVRFRQPVTTVSREWAGTVSGPVTGVTEFVSFVT